MSRSRCALVVRCLLTGNVSAGLARSSGNRDTFTPNAGYEFLCNPKTRNRIKSQTLKKLHRGQMGV
jgi:hypothetical protein